MIIIPTKHGVRLSEHGVVISELRTSPGPTHSVFDVLAALIAVIAPAGRVGVLGFAGGGIMAPLQRLKPDCVIDSVDLNRAAYNLFRKHCPAWTDRVNWRQGDAVVWLRQQPARFSLLMDDLSVPSDEDVIKPEVCWKGLPELMRQRLRRAGVAVFNLLPNPESRWKTDLERIIGGFKVARIINLDAFENRILVAGADLPDSRELSRRLRTALRALHSRQAERFQVRTLLIPKSVGNPSSGRR